METFYTNHILFAEMPAPAEEIYVVREDQVDALKTQLARRNQALTLGDAFNPLDIYGSGNSYQAIPELGCC